MFESPLAAIPADDRDIWFRVGSAIKTEMGDEGFTLWDSWSQTSKKYDSRIMRAQWRSFRPGLVAGGTIYHLARLNGWQGEERELTPPARPIATQLDSIKLPKKKAIYWQKRIMKFLSQCEYTTHPYFARKGFPDHQVLVSPIPPHPVVIPVHNTYSQLISYQIIMPDGTKRFPKKSTMRGGFFLLGRGRRTWVVEGYATGLSVHLALNTIYRDHQVKVAFFAGNIPTVASAKRQDIVVADADIGGLKFAKKSGCQGVVFSVGDANDYHLQYGIAELAHALQGNQ